MNTANDVTQELIRRDYTYNPDTGLFSDNRKIRKGPQVNKYGLACGSYNRVLGYITIYIDGRNRLAHRLAWIYCNGPIPAGFKVDHISGIKTDNRLCNLRLASQSDNLRNCKVRKDNTSGIKGVQFDANRGKWAAGIGRKKLGRFDTLFDAACARRSAANAVFGAFARES